MIHGREGLPVEEIRPDGSVYWYHHDQLGSTRMLTDQNGDVAATATYDAYGAPTAATGTVTPTLGFAGEYRDAETGFIYLRARHYDPATGQFLTRDPLLGVKRMYGPELGRLGNALLGSLGLSGIGASAARDRADDGC